MKQVIDRSRLFLLYKLKSEYDEKILFPFGDFVLLLF